MSRDYFRPFCSFPTVLLQSFRLIFIVFQVDKDASLLFLQSTAASRQKFATCEVGTADLEVLQALKLRKFDKINSY